MAWTIRWLMVCLVIGLPGVTLAQSAQIGRLLESQLSSDDRVVKIQGFAGALSARATMEQVSIADRNGVWLELRDVVLDWSRAALLKGALEVQELSADTLVIHRLPVSEKKTPAAQSSGFRIPDLPISVQIDAFALKEVIVDKAVMGEAFRANVIANATLDGGGLDVSLKAQRSDAPGGKVNLKLSFDPTTEVLSVVTRVDEPSDGITVRALGLPGAPSLTLTIEGEGPLDSFAADVALSTDGQERFGGAVVLEGISQTGGRRFTTGLVGDIRPLLGLEARDFFGEQTRVSLAGILAPDGAFDLERLGLSTATLTLNGRAQLAPGGAPRLIALTGQMRPDDSGMVRLPISGTQVRSADLALDFDAAQGPDWQLLVQARDITAQGTEIDALTLTGDGALRPGTKTPFTGVLTTRANGLGFPADPALSRALGDTLTLQARVSASNSAAVTLSDVKLETAHLNATGQATLTPEKGRVKIDLNVAANAPDLEPFSGISGLPLKGNITTDLLAKAELPGGSITLGLEGTSAGLDIGQEALAPLLSPQSQLTLRVTRDENGTRINRFTLDNPQLTAALSGAVDDATGALDLTAKLADIGVFVPDLAGDAALVAKLGDLQGTKSVDATLKTGFGLNAALSGALDGSEAAMALTGTLTEISRFVPQLTGTADLKARVDLAAQTRPVQLDLTANPGVSAQITTALNNADGTAAAPVLNVAAQIDNLGVFVAALPGPAQLSANISDLRGSAENKGPRIDATLSAPKGLSARIQGHPTGPKARLDIAANARNLGVWVPALPGPATVNAQVSDLSQGPLIDATISAARGLRAEVDGRLRGQDAALDLKAQLADLGVFVPQLRGNATLTARLTEPLGARSITAQLNSAAGVSATARGGLSNSNDDLDVTARIARLSRFAAGLTGGANVTARLRGVLNTPQINAQIQTDSGAQADVTGRAGLPGGQVDLAINGALPLGLVAPFAGDRSLDGTANFDLNLRGAPTLSALSGDIRIAQARIFDPTTSLTVSPLSAAIALRDARAAINAQGQVNEGPFQMAGTLGLTRPFATDLSLALKDFAYRFEDIARTRMDATLDVKGNLTQRLSVGGTIGLSDTNIRVPDTGLGGATPVPEIRHLGAPQRVRKTLKRAGLEAKPKGTGPKLIIPLDVEIVTRAPVFVRGRGLDAAFAGGLRLRGTTSDPTPVGRIALQRGRLDFLGQRFDLDDGEISAAGSLIPRMRITAISRNDDVTARITLSGPVDQPELSLSSTPQLPEDEILSRILFGRGIDTLSPLQIARIISSLRTLSGKGGGFLGDAREGLGFDNLDLRSDEQTGATELAIGKTIAENVYSEVEVDSQGQASVNLNIDLTPNTKLRGSVSNSGDTGIGIFWEKDY